MNVLQNALAQLEKVCSLYEIASCRPDMRIPPLLLLLLLPGFAQITIQGETQISGGVEVNYPFTHTVQIMAYNPPSFGQPDYNNFINDVMTQPYVDGVTLPLVWSNIETAWPSTPCAPINTDVCQLDSAGFYHNYNWTTGATAYDQFASMSYPNGILQWFTPFIVNGVSTPKKVNFVLVGINISGNVNTATPEYVTSLGYVANFPSPQNRQDVMNTVLDCTNLAWKPAGSPTLTKGGTGGTTITVNFTGCCTSGSSSSFQTNDMVWVVGAVGSGSQNYDTPIPSLSPSWNIGGAPITVTPGDPDHFTYHCDHSAVGLHLQQLCLHYIQPVYSGSLRTAVRHRLGGFHGGRQPTLQSQLQRDIPSSN